MRIVTYKFKILILEIKDILHTWVYLHYRKSARLTGKLKLNLLKMVGLDVSVTCRVYEFTWLKTANLSNHHCQKGIGSEIEWHSEEHVSTALIELA